MPSDTNRFRTLHSEIEKYTRICPQCGGPIEDYKNPEGTYRIDIPTVYCPLCKTIWYQWQESEER